MRILVYIFLGLVLLCGLGSKELDSEQDIQMDVSTLIQLLNFSKTLVQDGEIKFLFYEQFPTHPDDVGDTQRFLIKDYEKQLRENPPKSENPASLRKEILRRLEREKKFGKFRDSEKKFSFVEGNLVFQKKPQYGYRMEVISRFEGYPSLELFRFFNGGDLFYFFSNGTKTLRGLLPGQVANDRRIGHLERRDLPNHPEVMMATQLPPAFSINETKAEVRLLEDNNDEPVYIITSRSGEKIKKKVYVKIESGLPEVTHEETYYKSDSPLADAEGYWLRLVNIYGDFERVDGLNITVPKVREEQEYRGSDGFMRRRTVMVIQEMDFNLGLPINFFDWDESELTDDEGRRKRIRGDVQKKDTDKETIK